MAAAGEVPHTPYYGSVDATPLFLVLLSEYDLWTDDAETLHELLPAAERALAWLDRWADRNDDGLLEYQRRTPRGLRNQGWKDSHDGVPFADGTPAEPPIALVEVQGYAVDARRRMASFQATAPAGRSGGTTRSRPIVSSVPARTSPTSAKRGLPPKTRRNADERL